MACPDDRRSSHEMHAMAHLLERSESARVTIWFLREHLPPWPGTRVVDHLRTWWPARTLEAIGAARVAAALRGLRLRRWLRALAPDIVVLDDAVGERVIEHAPGRPLRVVRLNSQAAPNAWMESERCTSGIDLVLADPAFAGHRPAARMTLSTGSLFSHRPEVAAASTPAAVEQTRRQLGVRGDGPLLVGWGTDGWLDGPDVFIRCLWALRRRGVHAHALWMGLGADPHEVDRLRSEADRCGVGEQLTLRQEITLQGRVCGDAVLLSDRSGGRLLHEVIEVVESGCPVVAFDVVGIVDDGVTTVETLDVEAAAERLEHLLADRDAVARTLRRTLARRRLDVCGAIDELTARDRDLRP